MGETGPVPVTHWPQVSIKLDPAARGMWQTRLCGPRDAERAEPRFGRSSNRAAESDAQLLAAVQRTPGGEGGRKNTPISASALCVL